MVHISELILEPDTTDQGAVSDAVALAREIEQYNNVCEHNIALLNNGGRPSGAVVVPGDVILDSKTRSELQSQINSLHSGAQNAGRTMLLEGGLDWKNFATSPKDGDYNTTKADAEAQIFKALGVPLELAGSSKSVSANNLVNIRREFYYSRVVPLMEDILEFFNNFILPRYGRNAQVELQVDKEAIDVFIEDIAARRKLVEGSLVMEINEKRKMFRLPEIDGGNKIVDPNGRPIAGADAGEIVGAIASPPISG
jgi:HK97 family phage portal protein